MSYTVVLDEAERDRRMVNHLNEILRHCRIGRVQSKVRKAFSPEIPVFVWPSSPIDDLFRRPYVPTFSSGGTADVPIVSTHGVMM
jgi:hypothetical protein